MKAGQPSDNQATEDFDALSRSLHSAVSLLSIPEDSLFSSQRDDVSIESIESPIPRIDPERRSGNSARRNRSGDSSHRRRRTSRSRRSNRNGQVNLVDNIPVMIASNNTEDDDIESGTRRSRLSLSIKEQQHELDESFMMYNRAEKAALMIQKKFRDRHPDLAKDMEQTRGLDDTSNSSENDDLEKEGPSTAGMLTTLVIALTAVVPMVWGWISKCMSMMSKGGSDGGVDGGVIAPDGGAVANGGGGGAGGGAPPQPNPAQAMAGQAAAAAGAGAAAGVGAAAGAAAGAAGAAAAGAAGAAGAAASAVTVAAAAAATVAGVSLAAGGTNTTLMAAVPILSTCGIVEPQVLPGRVTFLFEGFDREFDNRESVLLEGLLVEAYNNITLGPERDNCQDKYLREVQSAKLFNQSFFPETEFNNSYVETTFETLTVCEGCPNDNPMFGDTEKVSRRRLQEELSTEDFFLLFLQKLLLDVKEMSDDGEIMEGFLQMKRGYVSDSTGEETMVTEIITTYNDAGDIASLTLAYTESGQDTKTTTVDLLPVETSAPTITVTLEPTTPEPTMTPSLSLMPSPVDATSFPSGIPSIFPSEFPSINPSESPSQVPSTPPSEAPSVVPSPSPSATPTINFSGQPTREPSKNPSSEPSVVPSESPSMVPSVVPSDQPSVEPSVQPSDVPSDIPSFSPSIEPSIVPSDQPSDVPSFVPSISPSDDPTSVPSIAPTRSPSLEPTKTPTSSPTISIRPTPCIWRAAERRQGGSVGNGPKNCTGIDRTLYNAPIYIYDQSQEGDTVSFRVNWEIFTDSVMSLAAMTYDSSATSCETQTAGSFTSRNFNGVCTNGSLEVIFYFYMCGEEVNVDPGNYCSRPSDMSNYREWRYLLDCYEVCETEAPTSGPTSGPTVSLVPTTSPSASPSASPSSRPSQTPSLSVKPSRAPSKSPTIAPVVPSNTPSSSPSILKTPSPNNGKSPA